MKKKKSTGKAIMKKLSAILDHLSLSSNLDLNKMTRIIAYPHKAPNTNMIHPIIQMERRFVESETGLCSSTLLKMLIRTKNNVTKRVIRPGMTSGGIMKLT